MAIGATLALGHHRKLHLVRFTSRVLKDAEIRYYVAEREVLALLRGQPIRFYTQFSKMKWLFKSIALMSRALQFAVLLSPREMDVIQAKNGECNLTGLYTAYLYCHPLTQTRL